MCLELAVWTRFSSLLHVDNLEHTSASADVRVANTLLRDGVRYRLDRDGGDYCRCIHCSLQLPVPVEPSLLISACVCCCSCL